MALRSLNALNKFKAVPFPKGYPRGVKTFFAPVDDIHNVLLKLINSATSSLALAMYTVEDPSLAQAVLEKMKDPKITVQVTLDLYQTKSTHEKTLLTKKQYPRTSIAIGNSEQNGFMHLKMLIIDGLDVATGSCNWTKSGQYFQDNNLLVIRNRIMAEESIDRLNAIHQFILNKQKST